MVAKKVKRTPITQDSLLKAKYVCDGRLSPDGSYAVYVLAEKTGKGDKESQHLSIWKVSVAGGKPKKLTKGKGSSWLPRFSRDGSTLYFLSSRDKTPQVFAMPMEGGDSEAVTSLEQGVMDYALTSNGSLVFTATAQPPKKPDINNHGRIDRGWFRFDPVGGYLKDHHHTLFTAKPKGKPRPLSEGPGMIMGISVSPDDKRVAFRRTGLAKHNFVQNDVLVVDISGKSKPKCWQDSGYAAFHQWHSDGERLICIGQTKSIGDASSLYLLDQSGAIKNRTSSLDLQPFSAFESHVPVLVPSRMFEAGDGKSLYLTFTRGGEAHLNRLSLTGKARTAELGSGQETNWLVDNRASLHLLIRQDSTHPSELFLFDENTCEKTQLTHHNEDWHKTQLWPDVERLIVKVKRGVEVEGWVMRPKGARSPSKTILVIHGGPHGAWGNTFWCDMHELVGAGYAVAFMNPRGSTGYGKAFMQSIHGVWGYPEIEDFNAFLDELVKRKISNPDKIGVTGISGGGHLSAWLIGHSNRYKAAVPEQGVYNMLSMWGESDAGQPLLDMELGTTPHKDPMKYWKHSPIAYANKVKTPTLLLQGNQDVRCPVTQADELFYTLQHYGCVAELIHLERCNHGEQLRGRIPLRRYRMNVMREWFDKYVR